MMPIFELKMHAQCCGRTDMVRRNRCISMRCAAAKTAILLVMLGLLSSPGIAFAGCQIWFNPNYGILIPITTDSCNNEVFNNYGWIDLSSGTFNNYSTMFNQSGATITSQYNTFNNSGTLENRSGGKIYMTYGSTLNNSGTLNNSWILTIGSNDTLNNTGKLQNFKDATLTAERTLNNRGEFYNSGTVINSGLLDNQTGGRLYNNGKLTNTGTVTNSGSLENYSGGSLENSVKFRNLSGGSVNNSASITNSGTFDNEGMFDNNDGGTLTNSGTLQNYETATLSSSGTFNNSGTLTNYGKITNTGTWTNSGTLINEETGTLTNSGTLINNGTVTIASGSVFTQDSSARFSGSGTIVLEGTLNNNSKNAFSVGTLKLDGGIFNQNGSGSATISAAVVAAGKTGTIQGGKPIALTTADVNGTLNVKTAISGSGALTKTGTGTLVLSGTNTYTGGTTVSAGILQGNVKSIQGTVNNNAAVVFNQEADGIFSGPISGTGTLTKTGAGLLTLLGSNTYTGATAIDAGTLAVNGGITSSVTIGSSGTLIGSGNITGNVMNNGNLSAGSTTGSIGTLRINGDYTHNAGSTYTVDLNPVEATQLLVTGNATLNGGNVSVVAGAGTYAPSLDYKYTILSAGIVTGTFEKVLSNYAFLTPTLSYDPTKVYLTLTRNATNFADVGQNANQNLVGNALDRTSTSSAGDMQTLMSKLLFFSAQEARATYDRITGFSHLTMTETTLFSVNRYLETVMDRMGGFNRRGYTPAGKAEVMLASRADVASDAGMAVLRPEGTPRWGFWIKETGSSGKRSGDDIAARYDYWNAGITAGFDRKIGDSLLIGVSTGYSYTKASMKDLNDSGSVAGYQGSLYGAYLGGPWYVNAVVAYGFNRYDTTRQIVFGPIVRPANALYDGHTFAGYAEAGYLYRTGFVNIVPTASLQAAYLSRNAFAETDAGALNLNVEGSNTTSLISSLGVSLRKDFRVGAVVVVPDVRARWLHDFINDGYTQDQSFAGSPAAVFTVRTDRPARDRAVVGLGVTLETPVNLNLVLSYDATVANDRTEHGGMLALRYAW